MPTKSELINFRKTLETCCKNAISSSAGITNVSNWLDTTANRATPRVSLMVSKGSENGHIHLSGSVRIHDQYACNVNCVVTTDKAINNNQHEDYVNKVSDVLSDTTILNQFLTYHRLLSPKSNGQSFSTVEDQNFDKSALGFTYTIEIKPTSWVWFYYLYYNNKTGNIIICQAQPQNITVEITDTVH